MSVLYEIATPLKTSAPKVWDSVTSISGLTDELRPLLRMTFPAHVTQLDETTVRLGERLCRSWLLLFGVLPVEYDDLILVEFEPGRRFLERSSMLSIREWQHERIIEPIEGGCLVTDRLQAIPRLLLPAPLVRVVVRALFQHRHRRLVRRFGALT